LSRSSGHPCDPEAPPRDASQHDGERERGPQDDITFGRVALGEVDDTLGQPQDIGHLSGFVFGDDRRKRQSHRQGRIADGLQQLDEFGRRPGRFAASATEVLCKHTSGRANGQRPLVADRRAQLRQLIEAALGETAFLLDVVGERTDLVLDFQGGEAGADRVVIGAPNTAMMP
jgi:hypothetical protein